MEHHNEDRDKLANKLITLLTIQNILQWWQLWRPDDNHANKQTKQKNASSYQYTTRSWNGKNTTMMMTLINWSTWWQHCRHADNHAGIMTTMTSWWHHEGMMTTILACCQPCHHDYNHAGILKFITTLWKPC